MCDNDNQCLAGIKTFTLMNSKNKSLYPIGLAKDGHIIWGPYRDDGQAWAACDVDVCNGNIING
jgi:hypothetical protein